MLFKMHEPALDESLSLRMTVLMPLAYTCYMCMKNDLVILNGLLQDSRGDFTCISLTGSSVIDYFFFIYFCSAC